MLKKDPSAILSNGISRHHWQRQPIEKVEPKLEHIGGSWSPGQFCRKEAA